mmetsp:Transcript_55391/g.125880  ORF Transcript_55391/g.125880 Transcript_55391/m.125880 type:complete len:94 (-) Transcript_55391:468-749(-)
MPLPVMAGGAYFSPQEFPPPGTYQQDYPPGYPPTHPPPGYGPPGDSMRPPPFPGVTEHLPQGQHQHAQRGKGGKGEKRQVVVHHDSRQQRRRV